MPYRWKSLASVVLVAGTVVLGGFPLQNRVMSQTPFSRRAKVPPLPEGLTWINAAGPLELADLRGKFVLLDFWTYCCINCMHVLPEIARLEETYPKNLVVIGVHSAKFEGEKDSANITEAVLRYKIKHPVINDADHRVWDRFGVRAWPTLLLIDPEGYAVWGTSGETTFEVLDKVLKRAIPYYRRKGLLDETPLRFDAAAAGQKRTQLRFPGKVLADERGGRLFIADSGHDRIVVTRLDGTPVDVVGSGRTGRADGNYAKAQFNDPQGMALAGQSLYVADNRNHLIRKIDLANRMVTTVAGTGQPRRDRPNVNLTARPLKTALSSPWALCTHEDSLYVAMAGVHQIWRMRLDGSGIRPYAGNGREDIVDGPLLPEVPYAEGYASFAQPSGLASDGTWLYVADSEGSSIRAVPFNRKGNVRTVVGTSGLSTARLFTFGDVDGPRDTARLQHPLGITFARGKLYVADTYNNKVKVIDPASGETTTLAGSGKQGHSDAPPTFDEPAGISAAAGKLYLPDTNNHLVRVVDLAAGHRVSTLEIRGLAPPELPGDSTSPASALDGETVKLKPAAVRAENGAIRLAVSLALPEGYEINPLAPTAYTVTAAAAGNRATAGPVRREVLGKRTKLPKPAAKFEISLPVEAPQGKTVLEVALVYYYCREGKGGVCKVGRVTWRVPVEVGPEAGAAVVSLSHKVR